MITSLLDFIHQLQPTLGSQDDLWLSHVEAAAPVVKEGIVDWRLGLA